MADHAGERPFDHSGHGLFALSRLHGPGRHTVHASAAPAGPRYHLSPEAQRAADAADDLDRSVHVLAERLGVDAATVRAELRTLRIVAEFAQRSADADAALRRLDHRRAAAERRAARRGA